MIVVDSSVWICLLRKQDSVSVRKFKAIADTEMIIVGDLVMVEVLQGARDDLHSGQIEKYLRTFSVKQIVNDKSAVRAAMHYRQLRRFGVTPRRTIDVLIATYCIQHQYALLHQDRDFDHMQEHFGLTCI